MEEGSCAVCGNEGPFRCKACRAVRYCSKAHQVAHWNQHKLKCRTYKVKWDNENGNYNLVAFRDLQPGEILLMEDSAVDFPIPKNGTVVCVECCRQLTEPAVGCPQCNWPMCGRPECWGDKSQHTLGECSQLKKAGQSLNQHFSSLSNADMNPHVFVSIMILRCLSLRERDPVKFEQLMELSQTHCSKKALNCMESCCSHKAAVVIKLVNKWFENDPVSEELIIKLLSIHTYYSSVLSIGPITSLPKKSNSSGDVDNNSQENDWRYDVLYAFYPLMKKIGPCCVANSTLIFTKINQVVVRATVLITKGSKISLDIVNPLLSTTQRQNRLFDKGFLCRCDRCKDPTELGTFTSGIYCMQCPVREGILLSEDPFNENSDWVCNKVATHWEPHGFISSLLLLVEDSFSALDLESILECEAFIDRFEKIIHPHHSFMTKVKMALFYQYGYSEDERMYFSIKRDLMCPFAEPEEADDEEIKRIVIKHDVLKKKETLGFQLLKLLDIISPGSNRHRGMLLAECVKMLYSGLEEFVLSTSKRDVSFYNEYYSRSKVMGNLAGQAVVIFSWEDKLMPLSLGRLAENMMKTLKYVKESEIIGKIGAMNLQKGEGDLPQEPGGAAKNKDS